MNRKNPYVNTPLSEYDLTVLSLDGYELECYWFFNLKEPLLYVWDCQKLKYNIIGDFFRFNWDEEAIDEYIITGLEKLINFGKGNEIFTSVLTNALSEVDFTYFSSKSDLTNIEIDHEYSIETKLFLEIAKLWYYFLILSNHKIK